MKTLFQALFLLVCMPMLFSSCGYNKLAELESAVESQWGNVESAYQRRADLVPIVKATIPGVPLGNIEAIAQEAKAINIDFDELDGKAFDAFDQSQNKLKNEFANVMNQATNNPELASEQALKEAIAQIEGAENRINTERRKFNQAIAEYNSYRNALPQKFTARITGFKSHSPFESKAN